MTQEVNLRRASIGFDCMFRITSPIAIMTTGFDREDYGLAGTLLMQQGIQHILWNSNTSQGK